MTTSDRRARKKAGTRRAIADAALPLFLDRGFDAVTLAEIADAADVSVKTIHNHFGSKEDVFFDMEPAILRSIHDAVGVPLRDGRLPLDALSRLLSDNRLHVPGSGWEHLDDPDVRREAERFMATLMGSRTLTVRWLAVSDRIRAQVDEALRGLVGPAEERMLLAAMLTAVITETHRRVVGDLLVGAPRHAVEARARRSVAAGLDRVARAYPDLVHPVGAPAAR